MSDPTRSDLISASPCRECELWRNREKGLVAGADHCGGNSIDERHHLGAHRQRGRAYAVRAVTGETLNEGIHLINPLKAVQKLSIQTQSIKESANVPSNEGLILALDTSLLFRSTGAWRRRSINRSATTMPRKSWSQRCVRQFAHRPPRTRPTPYTPTRANWCSTNSRGINGATGVARGDRGNVLLRDVQLPAMLKGSIEAKQQPNRMRCA